MILSVGNLAPREAPADLRKSFEAHGRVTAMSVPAAAMKGGKPAGPGRGYAFVTLPDPQEALAAVRALHGKELLGSTLDVHELHASWTRRRRS